MEIEIEMEMEVEIYIHMCLRKKSKMSTLKSILVIPEEMYVTFPGKGGHSGTFFYTFMYYLFLYAVNINYIIVLLK